MGAQRPSALTLDAGALIAIEAGDGRIRALLTLAAQHDTPVYVPTAVIAEVWRGGTSTQARLATFFKRGRRNAHVQIVDLDYAAALQIGVLLSVIDADAVSISDAMVAWCVKRRGGVACTGDPNDLRHFLAQNQIHQI